MFKRVAIAIIAALILLTPPQDPDFGWHLKYGEYFLQNKALLTRNEFSYSLPEYSWANSYWVSQIIIATLYLYGGAFTLSFSLGLLLSAAVVFTLARQTKHLWSIALVFCIQLSEFLVSVRPLLFSSVFFIVLFTILNAKTLSTKKLALLIPMFCLWANMHADFIVGLSIFVFYVFFQLTKVNVLPKPNLVLILIGCGLVTLINPYGLHLIRTLLLEINPNIDSFREFNPLYSLGSGPVLIVSSVLTLLYIKQKPTSWFTFVLVLSFLMGINAIYFYRIYVLATLFTIEHIKLPLSYLNVGKIKSFATACLIIVVPVVTFRSIQDTVSETAKWATKYKYPFEAVSFIRATQPRGKMLNNYDWGGFLVWQLPEYKTYIDGRMAAWRDNDTVFFKNYLAIKKNPYQNMALLDEIIESNNIGFVIDKNQSKLTEYLQSERSWKQVYADELSIVLLKPEN